MPSRKDVFILPHWHRDYSISMCNSDRQSQFRITNICLHLNNEFDIGTWYKIPKWINPLSSIRDIHAIHNYDHMISVVLTPLFQKWYTSDSGNRNTPTCVSHSSSYLCLFYVKHPEFSLPLELADEICHKTIDIFSSFVHGSGRSQRHPTGALRSPLTFSST